MHSFPLIVLDNFFDEPDEVRKFALSQEFHKDPRGVWPGLRTKPLHQLNPVFFEQTFNKYFSLFFTKATAEVYWEVDAMFQLVDNSYGGGWIHVDSGYTDGEDNRQIINSGIVYLTPDMPVDSGTSIYRLKRGLLAASTSLNTVKEEHYHGNITGEDAVSPRNIHNSQYEETVRVGSVYNRLISFEANQPHAAQSFFGEKEESRLTLVFFIKKFLAGRSPVQRMRHLV